MTEPKDHGCPECGAPRGADHTPSCACTERASEALRDAREAQVAAAEDFDPLRIRPYVELDGAPDPDPSSTMPLRTPLSVPAAEPNATDLHLFEAPSSPPEPTSEERPRGRRRTVLLLGAAAGMVGVVAAAGMASGLFSYESPTRDTALPEAVRASVPDPTPSDKSTPAPKSASPSRTSASPSPSATKSESPAPSASSASATPSATQSPTPSSTPAKASDAPPAETTPDPGPPVLRRGDKGPEVTELQLRLNQLYLYNDDINGNFNRQLEDALRNYQWSRGVGREDLGVYTAETRASLESETTEP
ncbi:peptidoglycan-binding protein [Streptomyces sp. P17]|uniref:peptidoglycan-binding protein n=1 Tax=Streptomyces sp. P17 TaxID=3074716 RepID=UPI0028F43558|nr:peptidoglycan-binding protein [Streptomyces sp. P17]MDT9698489.1 peptidoglycan-binding protein [Streptomyces sp. P17]